MNSPFQFGGKRARGVGYCTNARCPQFLHTHRQLRALQEHRCGECGELGALELERGVRSGAGPVSEVRIEFGFDPRRVIYLERLCLRQPFVQRVAGVFTLQTPLIATSDQARTLAATLLRELARPAQLPQSRRESPGARDLYLPSR